MAQRSLQQSAAEIVLDVPWLPDEPVRLESAVLRRGPASTLRFDDGIVLEVAVIDPRDVDTAEEALRHASAQSQRPGRVALVAGAVPLAWRAALRSAGVSWLDRSGVAWIDWPRVRIDVQRGRVRAGGRPARTLLLRKQHGVVVQELVVRALEGRRHAPLRDLALAAGVHLATASRTVSELAEHGLVRKERHGRQVVVAVTDAHAITDLLADRTGWPTGPRLWGYAWGSSAVDAAQRLFAKRKRAAGMVVTGTTAAIAYGVLVTVEPVVVRVRLNVARDDLTASATAIGIEPAPREEANVEVSADRWGLGRHRSTRAHLLGGDIVVAHPVRVWCDLQDERRGQELADQLWRTVDRRPG